MIGVFVGDLDLNGFDGFYEICENKIDFMMFLGLNLIFGGFFLIEVLDEGDYLSMMFDI